MHEWIDKAVTELKAKDEAKARRESAILRQNDGLWTTFKLGLESAVKQINESDYLMSKWSREKVEFKSQPGSEATVNKQTFPQFFLRVVFEETHFEFYRSVINDAQTGEEEVNESLAIDLDANENVFLKSKDGKHHSVATAVEYLLRPLVR